MQRVLRSGSLVVKIVTEVFLCVLQLGMVCVWAAEDTPTEALRSLMNSALSAAREGNQAKLEEIAQGLRIPNYEAWFKATFGDEEGTKLAAAYAAHKDQDEESFPKLVQGMAEHEGKILAEDAREPKASFGNYCGQELLKAAKTDATFYRVSLEWVDTSGQRKWSSAGYFALVEGAYRRLTCASLAILGPIRVGGNVQSARIIKKVPPVYPEEARQAHISGTVRLHVIIAKDGTMKELELVSGHPLLAPAALDAVRQWVYQPTLLNGYPVEVDTTIDVIFALNVRPSRSP